MEHVHFMWKLLYPDGSKCGFVFWVERHKSLDKNIHSHLLGINWVCIGNVLNPAY